jgi:RecB family exonuclease
MPSTHHKYSPSKLKNLAICPGYLGSETTSEAAEEGTMLHECCETGILPEGLTDEQKHLVKMCRDYATQLETGARDVLSEKRLEILDGALFGTADIVIRDKDGDGHIVDYKFGRIGVEEAETNLQGWAYACGVFALWPDVEALTVHFLQPRRDEVSTWTFGRDADYPHMKDTIAAVILRAEQQESCADAYTPQHGNCLWCGRKAECPRVAELTAALVAKTHNTLALPDVMVPAQMTVDQLTKALDVCGIIKDHVTKWVDLCKAEALQRTKNGQQIGDYVLERRAGKRTIVDPILASGILARDYGFSAVDVATVIAMSITEMEKIVRQKAGKGKGAKAIDELQEKLEAAGLVVSANGYEYLKKLN